MLLRILDVISTLLAVDAFGREIEMNPVSRFWLERGLFIPWQIIFTMFFYLLFIRFNTKPMRIGLKVFNAATLLVVAVNFISYGVAKGVL